MKRSYLILGVLIVACVLLLQIGCEEQAGVAAVSKPKFTAPEEAVVSPAKTEMTEPETDKQRPKITFEKVTHNFGEIAPGSKNVCEFKFTNTGAGLLKISNVSKTCGCTPYTLSKKEYAAGESGTLKVRYNSGKRPGSITNRLYVSSNDKVSPKVTLTIKAKIAPKVRYEPKKLNLLLNEENAGCPEITLSSLNNLPFSIRRFNSTANCITADFDSSVKATRFVLEPKVDMEKLGKGLNGRIDIGLTHPQCDTVTIPFNVLPKFKIEPPLIIIFKAEPEKPITREVWILNNYDEEFEIESTSSKKGITKVLSQEKIGNRYKLKLEITPPAAEDKQRLFSDVFSVNIKGGEKLEITCRGFYSKKAEKPPN